MTRVAVTKGSLIVVSTGRRYDFQFNPTTINDSHPPNFADQEVPGVSHPISQYTSGGARDIGFELYLDGEMGRRFLQLMPRNSLRQRDEDAIDITDWIQFYQSLVHPRVSSGQMFTDVQPEVCLLNLGPLYDGVPVTVRKADPTITYFTPDMRPLRATIDMQLRQKITRSVSAQDIFRE